MSVDLTSVLTIPEELSAITVGVLFQHLNVLITGHINGDLVRWNLTPGTHQLLYECGSEITSISSSPRNEIAVGCHSGLLFTIDLDDHQVNIIQDATYSKTSRVWRVRWVSDDSLLVSSTYGVLNLFQRNPVWGTTRISGHTDSIFALGQLDGKLIASGDWSGKILIHQWDNITLNSIDEIMISGAVEAISWHREGSFATVDELGHINYFERIPDTPQWRSVFETDIGSSKGTSVLLSEDGMTVFAGTNTELIQFDIDTQQVQIIPVANTRSIFANGNNIFVLTNRTLLSFYRNKIAVAENSVKYQFSKVSLVGHTGAGKTTLASLITSGSTDQIKSTFGRRIWKWTLQAEENSPERRIIFHDHGGQETVLDTFLPFLADSDIVLIFFRKTDKSTFEKALKIREELESFLTSKTKIFFVETFIDHEIDEIDRDKLSNLVDSRKIMTSFKVSPTTGEGVEVFKEGLMETIDWDNTRTMIRSESVESLERTILTLVENKSTVIPFNTLKKMHENNSGRWITTRHMKFLLTNFTSQGSIEYYPNVLEMIIFNDERYNQLRSNVPIAVEHKNGIIAMKELQSKFSEDLDYLTVLDQFYRTYRIAIDNDDDLRIFPSKLKRKIADIPKPYKDQLDNPRYEGKLDFPIQKIDKGGLITALSEIGLLCVDASVNEGVFAWENDAVIYYTYEEAGDALKGRFLRFSFVIGGSKKSKYDRLNSEFNSIVQNLYGPDLLQTNKKKDLKTIKFDVALSFAGEQREYVEQVAKGLISKGIKVFYDEFHESYLWGKNLAEYFQRVYYSNSDWCIMFISADYLRKALPTHERKNAMAKQILHKDDYILPVRFDDTVIPGLDPLVAYQDARKKSPNEIVALFMEKFEQNST